MKLRPEQLAGHLAKHSSPIYLLTGDEPLLVDELRDRVREINFDEVIKLQADDKFKWQELNHIVHSPSLFSSKRLVELSIINGKPGKEGSKTLSEYCQNPPPDITLLITTPKLTQQQLKSKWVQAIDAVGVLIQVWPVDSKQLPQWIRQRMQSLGMTATHQGYQLLADKVEGNLLAAKQEIEKIYLCYGKGSITIEQLVEALSDHCRFNVFTLMDTALQGDGAKSLQIIQSLQHTGEEAILTLWALTREVRNLLQIKLSLKQGDPFDKLCPKYQIWPKRKPIVQQALHRLSEATLMHILSRGSNVDKMIKGREQGDPWLQLQQLCLALCGQPIFSRIDYGTT